MALNQSRGFTLIEVMIVVLIIAILGGVALPAYQDSVVKSRRAEAKAALLDLQNRMERYFIDKNTYATACITGELGGCPTANSVLGSTATEHGYYMLDIANESATGYTLKAMPQGAQRSDSKCMTLTLTNTGTKGVEALSGFPGPTSTAANCW